MVVRLEDFGGGTSVADNTSAFRSAMSALQTLGGGALLLGAGTYNLASASLGGTGIAMPSNVIIKGFGKEVTRLNIVGSTACYLFLNETSESSQRLIGFTAIGNSVTNDNSTSSFYWVHLTADATKDVFDCIVCDLRLENFGGDQWIWFLNQNPSHLIRSSGVDWGCQIISRSGNCRSPASLSVRSDAVSFNGNAGSIADCFVNGLDAELSYLKSGISVFGSVVRTRLRSPNLRNVFLGYGTEGTGSYAIILYDTASDKQVIDTLIESPVVSGVVDCAFYLAETKHTMICSPRVSGQTGTADSTLPKGAFSLNGANDVLITNPDISGCAFNFQIAGIGTSSYSSDMRIVVVGGRGVGASRTGVTIKASVIAALCGGIHFQGYSDTGAEEGAVRLYATTGHGLSEITFTDCLLGSAKHVVDLNASALSTNPSDRIALRGGRISAAGAGFNSVVSGGAMAGQLLIERVQFDASAGSHVVLDASTDVELRDNTFRGAVTSGSNMQLNGTRGTLVGNAAPNGSALVVAGSTQLGRNKPTWVAGPGCYVQSVDPGLTGTSPDAYLIKGWQWAAGTTWTDDRTGLQ